MSEFIDPVNVCICWTGDVQATGTMTALATDTAFGKGSKTINSIKGHTLKVQNPLNCFNSLAPDYCWYSGPAEIDNAQPAVDLESAYFENSAPANEEPCSTANQPCENPYDQERIYTNVTAGENPWQPKKTVNIKSQVKLDFFSISVIF